MLTMRTALVYLIKCLLAAVAGAAADISEATSDHGINLLTAKPGCPNKCGNLRIPYPFGISPACSLTPFFSLTCNNTFDPPKAFLINAKITNISENPRTIHEVLNISDTQIRVKNMVVHNCYDPNTNVAQSEEQGMMLTPDSPFVFSATANKIIVVGCGFLSNVSAEDHKPIYYCSSYCNKTEEVSAGECSRNNGCAENVITGIVREYYFFVIRPQSITSSFDPCGYSFIGEAKAFKFEGISDFSEPDVFVSRILENVPLVVDWVIGNQTCKEAKKNASNYICQQHTECDDDHSGIGGYRCVCDPGYEGNPYLPPGCTETVECSSGFEGDGRKDGSLCAPKFPKNLILGLGISFLSVTIGVSCIFLMIRKQRLMKMKEKLFSKNGGLLLKRQLSLIGEGGSEPIKIFTEVELKMATNNFADDCIAGRGGSGIVYKGLLKDKGFIAIKKAIIMDENKIEQFINELVILSQINHRNVVKLLGCCLEVKVPLLIYEFVPNGALFNHIHNGVHGSWLDWRHCLRIVSEIAHGLAYLHHSANIPIIHRDIKSANILLDHNYTAKISDFGASRLIPLGQTKWCTTVQGTLGYLDPEFRFTSELTEKSDVYSFGVLVAELLTRRKAVFLVRESEFRNLATYFVASIRKGKLPLILHPQLVEKARNEDLMFLAELVCQCLSLKRKDRPTMKDIVVQLDRLVNKVMAED